MQPPRRVFLFSGHMIDAPDRAAPRFPPDAEPVAAEAIAALVDSLGAGPSDLAIASGACGGDLLFAEAMRARGVPFEMYLPFAPAVFAVASVDFAGRDWHERFVAALETSTVHVSDPAATEADVKDEAYEAVNLRMLEAASRFGSDRIDFVCLWDGQDGEKTGGVEQLADEVRRRHGRLHRLDTSRLWT